MYFSTYLDYLLLASYLPTLMSAGF